MVNFIPYFTVIINIVIWTAFSYAITNGWDFKNKKD